MADAILIYGATGFTGRMIATEAIARGLPVVLAGRDANALAQLGEELNAPVFVASVEDLAALVPRLKQCGVLLNAAGPFEATAQPLIEACLTSGAHYLDIAGEPTVIEATAVRGAQAHARGVMLMPGVGFDVVPSDGLLMHVASRVHRAQKLWLAVSGLSLVSRGSAKTLIDRLAEPVWARRRGHLQAFPPGSLERSVDFGAGAVACTGVAWGDVASAYYSTGVPEITVYFEATWPVAMHTTMVRMLGWAVPITPWQSLLHAAATRMQEGPMQAERASARATLVACAEGADGESYRARLSTPEAYDFTVQTSLAIAHSVLRGDIEAGFETPGRLYGADYALGFAGVTREELALEHAHTNNKAAE